MGWSLNYGTCCNKSPDRDVYSLLHRLGLYCTSFAEGLMQQQHSVPLAQRGRGGREQLPPKFWAIEKLSDNFLSENFGPKMENSGLKTPNYEKILGQN